MLSFRTGIIDSFAEQRTSSAHARPLNLVHSVERLPLRAANEAAAQLAKLETRHDFSLIVSSSRRPQGSEKHQIPGISLGHGCDRGGREHGGGFETKSPCLSNAPLTRERLSSCLPDTSTPRCIQHLPPLDPDVRR